jgi:hypothetical protein
MSAPMLNLDTIKIEVPQSAVKSTNWLSFSETQRADMANGNTEIMRQAKSAALPVGVSNISWKEGTSYQITVSAKTLRDKYLTGININTLPIALKSLKPVIDIDIERLWDLNPKVYKCDTTDNLLLEAIGHTQKQICQALLAGRSNERYLPVYYATPKKLGVEFRGTQLEKNRIIIYSKNLDLLKSQNKEFMKSLNNPAKMVQDAERIIRFETNHTTFRSMKQRFFIPENSLRQVLESKQPVNHDFLVKVLKGRGTMQMELFDEWQSFDGSFDDFVMLKGIESIIDSFKHDDIAVKEFFKEGFGATFKYHFYKKKNSIKQVLAKIKAKNQGYKVSKSNGICNLVLKELLKAVA